jgi:hypothetical protein
MHRSNQKGGGWKSIVHIGDTGGAETASWRRSRTTQVNFTLQYVLWQNARIFMSSPTMAMIDMASSHPARIIPRCPEFHPQTPRPKTPARPRWPNWRCRPYGRKASGRRGAEDDPRRAVSTAEPPRATSSGVSSPAPRVIAHQWMVRIRRGRILKAFSTRDGRTRPAPTGIPRAAWMTKEAHP